MNDMDSQEKLVRDIKTILKSLAIERSEAAINMPTKKDLEAFLARQEYLIQELRDLVSKLN